MNKTPFEDFDFFSLWIINEYAQKYYIGTTPTDKQIEEIESELGYKLPQSYIVLIKQCNGGEPIKINLILFVGKWEVVLGLKNGAIQLLA